MQVRILPDSLGGSNCGVDMAQDDVDREKVLYLRDQLLRNCTANEVGYLALLLATAHMAAHEFLTEQEGKYVALPFTKLWAVDDKRDQLSAIFAYHGAKCFAFIDPKVEQIIADTKQYMIDHGEQVLNKVDVHYPDDEPRQT